MDALWVVLGILATMFVARLVYVVRRERREAPATGYMTRLRQSTARAAEWFEKSDTPAAFQLSTQIAARADLMEIKAQTWLVPEDLQPVQAALLHLLDLSIAGWAEVSDETWRQTQQAFGNLGAEMHRVLGPAPPPSGFRGTILGAFLLGYPSRGSSK